MSKLEERVAALPCWSSPVTPQVLGGGITNTNFTVKHEGEKFVVRVGDDIPVHGVMRFHERAAGQAAFECGISPEIIYTEPGFLVMRFIEGKTLTQEDVIQESYLKRIIPLLQQCHHGVASHIRGPILFFWVFHVIRDYSATLKDNNSRMIPHLPGYIELASELEEVVGRMQPVFGHNDLLPANIIDDGQKLWLIDWDYAGFTSPLFDLSNLASNNLLTPKQESWLLEEYFQQPVNNHLLQRYHAMKCASLLREAMWSMVSEIFSKLDFDYVAYTDENLQRFQTALDIYRSM